MMAEKGILVVVSGFSGAGKGTLIKKLMEKYDNYALSISATTRAPREYEQDGVHYFFRTREEFERMIKDGELYEYSAHHEHYYGTSKKLLNDKISNGKIIVKDIEVNGVENLLNILKDDIKIVTIFLRVPKEELQKRLENRVDKPSLKEIQLRLNRFDYEESKIGMYDYIIKNNNLEKTVQIIMTIINNEYNLKEAEF